MNSPAQLQKILSQLPCIYGTKSIPTEEKIIYLRFFIANCEWLIAEFDQKDEFFGFACLGDPEMAEWGYISLSELKSIRTKATIIDSNTGVLIGMLPIFVEWDQHFKPKPFSQIQLSAR
jgi:hypothetical protein